VNSEEGFDMRRSIGAPPVVCRCGHSKGAHQHHRPGRECSLGDPGHCDRFVAEPSWWRRYLDPRLLRTLAVSRATDYPRPVLRIVTA